MILSKKLDLPPIPQEIITQSISDLSQENKMSVHPAFASWKISSELKNYCENIFGFSLNAAYGVIQPFVHIHTDNGAEFTCNFLLDPGADKLPVTKFYKEDRKTVIAEFCFQPHNWYYFRTDIHHSIHGIDSDKVRTAIRIRPLCKLEWHKFACKHGLV